MSKSIQEREIEFQDAMKNWVETKSKKYWDMMFLRILDACTNILKSKAVGIHIRDLEEVALDSTLYCMHLIKDNGVRPEKLSSFCYLPCIRYLHPAKKQFQDKISTFTDIAGSNNIENEDRFFEEVLENGRRI